MNSMCLGMVADFDERAGDFPAAINALEAAIATNEELLGGFTGALLARLGWVLLQDGQLARARGCLPARARLGAPGATHHRRSSAPSPASPRCTGSTGATRDAAAAADEAMEIYRAGGPRRFRNRVDHVADLHTAAAVCCVVLAAIAAEDDEPERAATLLGQAERLCADAGVEVPAFQHDDAERARDTARCGARRGRVRRGLRARAVR